MAECQWYGFGRMAADPRRAANKWRRRTAKVRRYGWSCHVCSFRSKCFLGESRLTFFGCFALFSRIFFFVKKAVPCTSRLWV